LISLQECIERDFPITIEGNTIEGITMKESPNPEVRETYEKCVVEKNAFYNSFDDIQYLAGDLIDGKMAFYGSDNYLIGDR